MKKKIKSAYDQRSENIIQLMSFNIGPKLFGVDILKIIEIIRHPKIESVADTPEFIKGIIRIRGEVFPVIDLGHYVGISDEENKHDQEKSWVLITKVQESSVGYIVDSVSRILKISTNMILPAPELILSGLRNRYMRSVCDTEKGLLVVLEPDHLLGEEAIKAIQDLKYSFEPFTSIQ